MTHTIVVESRPNGRPWRDDAACVGVHGIWFPASDSDAHPAKRICARCPVRDECLEYALAAGEKYGVWGGHTFRERQALRRRRQRQRAADAAQAASGDGGTDET